MQLVGTINSVINLEEYIKTNHPKPYQFKDHRKPKTNRPIT